MAEFDWARHSSSLRAVVRSLSVLDVEARVQVYIGLENLCQDAEFVALCAARDGLETKGTPS
jgi:hypothetical protein